MVKDRFIIFDQNDGLRACRGSPATLRMRLHAIRLEPGQINLEVAPCPCSAFSVYKTIVLFNNAVSSGKPRPVPLPTSFVVKKGSKIFRGLPHSSRSWIAYRQQHIISRNELRFVCPDGIVDRNVVGAHHDVPAPEMASLALTARLARIWSTWDRSILIFQRSRPGIHDRLISSR